MSDVRYQDVYGTDPQDSFDSRFAGTPVAGLVRDDAPVAPANPLEYLYGSPGAAGETQRGPGAALRDIIQSGGRDAAKFLEQMATGPYRLVQEAMRNDASRGGVPPLSDEYVGAAMDAGGLAMGGGMPFAKPGAVGSAGGRLMQPPKVAEPFYSAVEQAIVAAPQAKMTPTQWKGYLRNQPSVKAEELDWMGLGDKSLHPQEWGNKPVTREQMLEHAEGHGVKLKEIEKRGDSPEGDEALGEIADQILRGYTINTKFSVEASPSEANGLFNIVDDRGHIHGASNTFEQAKQESVRLQREFNDAIANEDHDVLYDLSQQAGDYTLRENSVLMSQHGDPNAPTKFSEYQLPGGDNYRELLLLTLPKNTGTGRYKINEHIGRMFPYEVIDTKTGKPVDGIGPYTARRYAEEDIANKLKDTSRSNFGSSHWDEPNVLVHLRMNDRYLEPTGDKRASQHYVDNAAVYHFPGKAEPYRVEYPQGTTIGRFDTQAEAQGFMDSHQNVPLGKLKSLHLEEIQSDWHQQGRKKGYGPTDTTGWTVAPGKDGGRVIVDAQGNRKPGEYYSEKPDADLIKQAASENFPGVPDAPFKSTWADLALKRAITKAAHEGYDAVSWTPGAQQAERYDLSKQITEIGAIKNPDGTYHISGKPIGTPHNIQTLGENVKLDKLDDIVGKDLAKKIVEQTLDNKEWKIFKGTDLKVGGEGMKAFYDKMLVDKANALGKKFGAKVEWQELPSDAQYVVQNAPRGVRPDGVKPEDHKFVVMRSRSGIDGSDDTSYLGSFRSASDAGAAIPGFKREDAVKVPVLHLNDKLRDAATRRGMPLFSSGLPFRFTPVDHDPFADDRKPKYKFTPVDHDPFAGGA